MRLVPTRREAARPPAITAEATPINPREKCIFRRVGDYTPGAADRALRWGLPVEKLFDVSIVRCAGGAIFWKF